MGARISIKATAIAFCVFWGGILVTQDRVDAESSRSVLICGGNSYSTKSLRIQPEILSIDEGDVVIWQNWAKGREVRVIFEEEKVCFDDAETAAIYQIEAKNCFVSSSIPAGGKSNLRFKQGGRYKYTVETDAGIWARGEILVLGREKSPPKLSASNLERR